jgi:NAD(P)-dependent dehydrogenase (short-subunit alcohol dehydrogenase family)
MKDKRIALVTGANQGVGFQVAKELVAKGLTVLVGSRNFERGEASAKEIGPGAIALQLDVTDRVSIANAAERIRAEFGRLDLLVQNAAISNTRKAMLPLLRESSDARIVIVSSAVGSLTLNADRAYPFHPMFGPVYPASKAALNAITLAMMVELENTGIKVNLVSPGFTKTNLNGYEGTQSLEEGSREVVRVALLGPDGPTGTFTRWENATIPW